MKYSKPIIAVSDGEVKDIIQTAKCGFVSKPGNVYQLAKNFQRAFNLNLRQKTKLGKNANTYSEKILIKIKF